MPTLKIAGFDGLVPRMSDTMLGQSQAQQADNVKLYAGELRYWRGPLLDESPATSNIATIWRYYSGLPDPVWFVWDSDVDVTTAPTADLNDYRVYYTGDGLPKKTNETLNSSGSGDYPRDWLYLGVPAPTTAPDVTRVGSGASPEDRVYVYTFVSTFGSVTEESAPSPASALVQCGTGDSVTVDNFDTPPGTGYNITHIRIYRSVTGSTAVNYEFVAEITVATTSYSDSLTAAELGENLPSLGFNEPPDTLAGLVACAGGSLAGFSGNTVYFSEPYYPHAWPTAYEINLPHYIVGIAPFGQSLAVMTDRYPYFIHGIVPGQMAVERVPILEPCLSKRSICVGETGVFYASPNGLVALGPSIRGLITNSLFRRDEWQLINPQNIIADTYDNKYIGMYSSSNNDSFVLNPDDKPALSHLSLKAAAMHVDSQSGDLYFVDPDDNKIYKADADEGNPLFYEWKSKRFVLPSPTTWSAIKLDADFDQADLAAARQMQIADIQAANQVLFAGGDLEGSVDSQPLNAIDLNGSILANVPSQVSSRTAQVMLYGDDGDLETTLTIDSWNTRRIPPFKSRQFEIKIVGNMSVRSVILATTAMELRE